MDPAFLTTSPPSAVRFVIHKPIDMPPKQKNTSEHLPTIEMKKAPNRQKKTLIEAESLPPIPFFVPFQSQFGPHKPQVRFSSIQKAASKINQT